MKKEQLLELLDSWENLALIIRDFGDDATHFSLLMEIALHSGEHKSWRAAWLADKIHDKFPELILPYLEEMIKSLKELNNTGKKRQFLKLISLHPTPDAYDGFLTGYCLDTLMSGKEPPAVRVYAMQILYNISEKEPELKPELIDVIENEMELHPTPGSITRGKKILKKLYGQRKSWQLRE